MKTIIKPFFTLLLLAIILGATKGQAQIYYVTTVAGQGGVGYQDGPATNAQFRYPSGMVFDKSGNLLISDYYNHMIRRMSPGQLVSSYSSSRNALAPTGGFIDGPIGNAQFNKPCGITTDRFGNVFVADLLNGKVRKISSSGIVSTLPGSYNWPQDIVCDSIGNVYFSTWSGTGIFKITPSGYVSLFANLSFIIGLAIDRTGNIYACDFFNNKIKKIDPSGSISTFAGTGTASSTNGYRLNATFNRPGDIAIDSSGNFYVIDGPGSPNDGPRCYYIRKITSGGTVTTIAGDGTSGYQDGLGTNTKFNATSLAIAPNGDIYVTCNNDPIRRISTNCTPLPPVITASGPTTFNAGQSVTLSAPAGYPSYLWSNGATTQNITVSTGGFYKVTVSGGPNCSATSAGVTVTVRPFTNGLVCWYPLNGNARDSSGNGFHGITVGNPQSVPDRNGNPNGAFSFPTNGYKYIKALIGNDLPAKSRTVSYWFSVPNGGYLSFGYGGNGCGTSFYNSIDNSAIWTAQHCNVNPSGITLTNSPQNIWRQATIVYDNPNNKVYYYINGVLVNTVAATHVTSVNSTHNFLIGRIPFHNGEPYYDYYAYPNPPNPNSYGSLDDLRLYNVPLNAAQVSALYNGTPLPTACVTVPTVTASGPLTFGTGGSVTLTAQSGFNSYLWSNGATTRSITVNTAGDYSVSVTGPGGCVATSGVKTVKVQEGYIVSTIAGTTQGDLDGNASTAQLGYVDCITFDKFGNLVFSDWLNGKIKKLDQNGVFTTISSGYINVDHGTYQLKYDNLGNLFIAGGWGGNVYKVNTAGVKSTVVNMPGVIIGLEIDKNNNVYFTQYSQGVIYKLSSNGTLTTLASGFSNPGYLTFDNSANLLVMERFTGSIKKIDISTNQVTNVPFNRGNDLGRMQGIAVNKAGYIFVSSETNRIAKIYPDGSYDIVAGTGQTGYVDGVGTQAVLTSPKGFLLDQNDNFYFADSYKIRKLTRTCTGPTPTITASGPLTFSSCGSVTLTASPGSSYLWSNGATTQSITLTTSAYVKVTVTNATGCPSTSAATTVTVTGPASNTSSPSGVSTLAGTGVKGFANGAALAATFNNPYASVTDAAGNTYVADRDNNVIRKISASGTVSTFAGTGTAGYTNGAGNVAGFSQPTALAFDASGNLFVADYYNHAIRKISPAGLVSTFAGAGLPAGYADGSGTAAKFNGPSAMAFDAAGNLYVADQNNHRIRKITPAGVVTTLAGSTLGYADGLGSAAQFNNPTGIAVDASGSVFVADYGNHRIRKVDASGLVSTFAGSGTACLADGQATAAAFNGPIALAFTPSGDLIVADRYNNRIRSINNTGLVSTLAGTIYGFADGAGFNAKFGSPVGVSSDANGTIYVADRDNNSIRKILPCVAPTITASGSSTVCTGAVLTLTASSAAGYLWSNGATTKTITVNNTGSYSVKAVNGTCTSGSSNVITVTVAPCRQGATSPEPQVSVYPNPFTNILTLNLGELNSEKTELRLLDALGHEVLYQNLNKTETGSNQEIATDNLAPGIYLLQIVSVGGVKQQRVVKQ